MTREQKLALILGFALTLVVGVLISDHLSGARAASTPQLTDALTPADLPAPGMGRDTAAYAIIERTPPVTDATYATDELAEDLIQVEPPPSEPSGWNGTQFADAIRNWANGSTQLPKAANVETFVNDPSLYRERAADIPAHDPLRDELATQQKDASRELIHRVQKGDTLWKIAEQYYKDGGQWKRIHDRNRDRVMPNGQVRTGASIVIPGVPATAANDRPSRTAVTIQPKTYTVQRGDTLGEISMKTLGTSRRWREILELNKDRIDDPDVVPVGVELRLPAT